MSNLASTERGWIDQKKVPRSYASIQTEETTTEPLAPSSWTERNRILLIETALFTNVFLSGLDSTITASIYQLIGNEFEDVKVSSWITTAYLVTCTSFQPLYGSFSDTLGRRRCLFFANTIFALGCLGCGLTSTIYSLIIMRAVTGIGGGGLITLSTIVNSDIIPAKKRGMYQSFQNILVGTGAVVGASCGGEIASSMGWRWCFLLQVPISIGGAVMAYLFVQDQDVVGKNPRSGALPSNVSKIKKIDFLGAFLLISGLVSQLIFLTINSSAHEGKSTWLSGRSLALGLVTAVSLILFAYVEKTTTANPIIPHDLLGQWYSTTVLIVGVLVGFVSYAYIFTLPLYFQVVVGDTAAEAGLRLTVPSFCTPIGGVIMGISMKDPKRLPGLLIVGISLMLFGNLCFLLIKSTTPYWLTSLLLVPANIGQGITFPSTLFSFLFAFPPYKQATATATLYLFRSVGCVWGVAGTSSLIQSVVRKQATKRLQGILTDEEIKSLLVKLSHKTSLIENLPDNVRAAVLTSYEISIKSTYFFSVILCLIAIILALMRRVFKKFDGTNDRDLEEREDLTNRRDSFASLL